MPIVLLAHPQHLSSDVPLPDQTGRITAKNCHRRNRFCNHCTSSDNSAFPDVNAVHDDAAMPKPGTFSDYDSPSLSSGIPSDVYMDVVDLVVTPHKTHARSNKNVAFECHISAKVGGVTNIHIVSDADTYAARCVKASSNVEALSRLERCRPPGRDKHSPSSQNGLNCFLDHLVDLISLMIRFICCN